MMALWLLVLRGTSIEFRSHHTEPLWRHFWDGVFAFASTLMAIILGAALGNVIRGVPVEASGYFAGPLFTNFMPGAHPGVLDWYTVLVGVFTLFTLAGHGTLYLTWKTAGMVQARSRYLARLLWAAVVALGLAATLATAHVQPGLYGHLLARPWTWLLAAGIAVSLVSIFVQHSRGRELPAFLASGAFLVCMLGATAAGLYPNLLTSTLNHANDITTANATAGGLSLQVGLFWWTGAIVLAIVYFAYLFHSFRGKVTLEHEGHY